MVLYAFVRCWISDDFWAFLSIAGSHWGHIPIAPQAFQARCLDHGRTTEELVHAKDAWVQEGSGALGAAEVQYVSGSFWTWYVEAHTQLWSCMPSLVGCVRQCTKKAQQKHKDRMERKAERLRRRGETPPEYWKKLPGGKYQGGKDLAKSAEYPQRFATALFKRWQRAQMGA